jgi:hypothetical protein
MPLNPPICLLVYYTNNGGGDPLDLLNHHLYNFKFQVTPQAIGVPGNGSTLYQYDGTSIKVGMYTSNSFNGYVFRVNRIIRQTSFEVDLILEDVNGYNRIIDPTRGINGGGPIDQSNGYVFELNSNNLPVLISVDNPPSTTFVDSILARFLYFETTIARQGATGATGASGLRGTQGTQGLRGLQGIAGAEGIIGAQGLRGSQE